MTVPWPSPGCSDPEFPSSRWHSRCLNTAQMLWVSFYWPRRQPRAQASTLHRVQRVSRGDPCPQPLWDQINHVPQNCKNHFWKGWTREPLRSRSFLPKIHVFVDLAFVWDQVLDFSPFISQVLGIYHQDDLLWQRYGKARFSFQTWVKMWINRNSIPCIWWFFTSSELSNLLLEMQVFSVHFPSKNLFSWLPWHRPPSSLPIYPGCLTPRVIFPRSPNSATSQGSNFGTTSWFILHEVLFHGEKIWYTA